MKYCDQFEYICTMWIDDTNNDAVLLNKKSVAEIILKQINV